MLQQHLQDYLDAIPLDNTDETALERAATDLITRTKPLSSKDTLRSRWELALRTEEQEQEQIQTDERRYYSRVFNLLDLSMLMSENECVDPQLPFNLVREFFECLSIASCSQVFSWVERRGKRLCLDANGANRQGLLVLRTLNELLRSLSKSTETEFCARILLFMSAVFPLSERSGVNLRGEYGPPWEGPPPYQEGKELILEEAKKEETRQGARHDDAGATEMDDTVDPSEEDRKSLLYKTFWFLQYPFSRPPAFAEADMFKAFQHAVNKILPILSEATKKERMLAGSKTLAGSKRKRDVEMDVQKVSYTVQDEHADYAFAKYLSSPELLELEIADTNFRRQFLFQLLILLQYLRSFTEQEKAKHPEVKMRPFNVDFTLPESEENWVKEVNSRVMLELRTTTPDGRAFEEIIRIILERESNWVNWKNSQCKPFEKDALPIDFELELRRRRQELMKPLEAWPHSHGTESLSEIWTMGYRSLDDLTLFPRRPDPGSFVGQIQRVDKAIAMRKQTIERMVTARMAQKTAAKVEAVSSTPATLTSSHPLPMKPGSTAEAPKAAQIVDPRQKETPPPDLNAIYQKDEKIKDLERQRQTYTWLALRSASKEHLHLFNKIADEDIGKLVTLIKEHEQSLLSKPEGEADDPGEPVKKETSTEENTQGDVEMQPSNTTQEEAPASQPTEIKQDVEANTMSIDEVTKPTQQEGASMEVDSKPDT
ncbi:SubName: Full=Related to nuclear matrix protein p84 {ECO:0000313/EMBL:CCA68937.1} [Serendipita indica DSM 11827]|nr:SubName: Full=Related to nuclear matrix protein p84 {ECO:0000313/EMBL:CCA68937.1} [Serendipita indica DSM 11827]